MSRDTQVMIGALLVFAGLAAGVAGIWIDRQYRLKQSEVQGFIEAVRPPYLKLLLTIQRPMETVESWTLHLVPNGGSQSVIGRKNELIRADLQNVGDPLDESVATRVATTGWTYGGKSHNLMFDLSGEFVEAEQ